MTFLGEFHKSLTKSHSYPENLLSTGTTTYLSTRQSYRKRLDETESSLCLVGQDETLKDFEVPIRDLHTATGKDVSKRNIHSPEELTEWLGLRISFDPADPTGKVVTSTKADPQCRFIYIYAENSRDQLKITRDSLTEILTFHQVMPVYLDFMFVFGAQSDAKDLRFSGFREQTMISDPPRAPTIPALGRSGRHFQLCYNLKGVSFKKKNLENIKLNEWSIRQAAVYHQFDVVTGKTLWIVTKGRLDIQQRFKELTASTGRPEDRSFDTNQECFRSSLAAHLLFCHWSTEDWRWYIRWLEEVVEAESSMAVYGPRGPGYAHREYKPYHIQDLQYWQDKVNEAIMVLEANMGVISALRKFYTHLQDDKDFPTDLKRDCADNLAIFISQLDEISGDFNMQVSRGKLLGRIIGDRKELVLQHLQGQAAERTERLNMNLEREAIVMRIITIVTLMYLPATFVSTFFSTDIIKYQDQGGGPPGNGQFSSVALKRWLQVTLPLTAITLFMAWATYKLAETARKRPEMPAQTSGSTSPQPPPIDEKADDPPIDSALQAKWQGLVSQYGWSTSMKRISSWKTQRLPLFNTSQGTA